MTDLVSEIRERYLHTLEQIENAARKSNRDPQAIRLVVVTKSQPVAVAQAAIEAGVTILGENYPEEGVMKIQSLAAQPRSSRFHFSVERAGQSGVEWHMIGHVQSRKARLVADHFALLHSLDSLKLAQRLDRFAAERNHVLPVLLEFNLGGEENKSGWEVSNMSKLDQILPDIQSILDLPNLRVRGLMTMPPLGAEPEDSRRFFQSLRLLRDRLASLHPHADWRELSMGTSADYTVAVEEGATLVRVGTAIVGARTRARKSDAEAESK